ncbi:MAG: serine/threonine protein kinase, partial [Anaerolineae bacterium]|nr:serine/threonine protein kinase [Anaerolineae bacterium]
MSLQRTIAGRFRIESLIQRGGMGDVYRGTDLDTEQTIAIKTLNREMLLEDPLLLERFRREADVLRRLNHPNIVHILATVDEDSAHHIVMEYMSGGSLGDLIDQEGKLSLKRSVQIALDLTDALTRAHRLQIIHRDVKPANVLLAADGTPRLTDFGVAQMADQQTRLTQHGALLGTVAYLAPELCTGEAYSEKSDIWAFGIVIYEMLTGRRPFRGERPAELVGAIMNDPVSSLDRYRG